MKEAYKQLTNVDIDTQRQLWDDRGKGYYGEYLLFCELYKSIKGNGKILMNLQVPVDNTRTTEIDLVLVHETGLYVFEIKHYKGTIYGKSTDENWTQYFRTAKNNTFRNPVEQNRYHIAALTKLFPNVPIQSCIVFTSTNCNIRVINTNENVDICQLSLVNRILENRFSQKDSRFSINEIDDIFSKLASFSQMQETIVIDEKEADFFSWVKPIISELENKKEEVEKIKENWIQNVEKAKKAKTKGVVVNIVIAVVSILLSALFSFGVAQKKNEELSGFKQNFLHIDEINNEYIDALNSYVDVTNVSLLSLTDDAVSFTARIAMKNDVYGVAFTEKSKYIVMTTQGKVVEYDMFGEHLRYSRLSNMIGKGIRSYGDLHPIQFYGVFDPADVSYVKVTGVELFKIDYQRTTIKKGLEIELYVAD